MLDYPIEWTSIFFLRREMFPSRAAIGNKGKKAIQCGIFTILNHKLRRFYAINEENLPRKIINLRKSKIAAKTSPVAYYNYDIIIFRGKKRHEVKKSSEK